MPSLTQLDTDGSTVRTLKRVTQVDSGGVVRELKSLWQNDNAGVPRCIFNGFKASASPSSTTGYCYSGGFTTAITGIVTANVTGGTAPYTYAWTADSGWSALSPTNYASSFRSPGLSPGDESNGSAYVTVTDANGATAVSNNVDLYATNTHF